MSDSGPYTRAIANLRRLATYVRGARAPVATITADVNLLEAERRDARDYLLAERALAASLAVRVADLERRLEIATAVPDPIQGADGWMPHNAARTLADELADMVVAGFGPVSVLVLPAGKHGPLALDGRHAGLLRGRVLRLAGPSDAVVGPITMDQAEAVDATIELWGVTQRGGVHVSAPGFALRTMHGGRHMAARDAGAGVPV